eukprot:6409556-Prymnesium_polylepis.1
MCESAATAAAEIAAVVTYHTVLLNHPIHLAVRIHPPQFRRLPGPLPRGAETTRSRELRNRGAGARAMVFCGGSGTRQLILSELRQHSPFSAYLNEKQLRRLARACRLQRFAVGVELHSSPFYIMVTGKVRVESIATSETLCSRAEGDFFTRSVAS